MKFEIDEDELKKMRSFKEQHNDLHGREKTAIGGRFTYEFSPTSLGTVVKIRCYCGSVKDCTDYSSW